MVEETTAPKAPKAPKKRTNGKPKSLVTKLSQIMGEIEEVPMKGFNAHHNYKYVMEPELFDAIRGKMAANHIMLIPSITGVERIPEKGLVTISMNYRLMCGDTGEVIDIPWRAEGADASDKGINKATTAASKFLVAKMFLCVTDNGSGEAPDAENHRTEPKTASRQPRKAVTQTAPPMVASSNNTFGPVLIKDIEHLDGEKNGRKWFLHKVTFADGTEASTFKSDVGDVADHAFDQGIMVTGVLGPNGEYRGKPQFKIDELNLQQEVVREEPTPELNSEDIPF
jgi:hypothetical protein